MGVGTCPGVKSPCSGKVLWGYQGWFGPAPSASPGYGYAHWSRGGELNATNAVFDAFPDFSEYPPGAMVPTQGLAYASGAPVSVYSSTAGSGGAVATHFKWMADYGVDGVFLQRFATEVQGGSGAGYDFRNAVTKEVAEAAAANGRVWAVEYDVTGTGNNTARLENTLSNDFAQNIRPYVGKRGYLHHDGRPVIAVFGFGFVGDTRYPSDVQASVNALRNLQVAYGAYLVCGVPYFWRTGQRDSRPDFQVVYDVCDALSPWAVGRFNSEAGFKSLFTSEVQPDRTATAASGAAYAPVVWPGFSWANLQQDPADFNSIPRLGGAFLTAQTDAMVESLHPLPDFIFGAMFDEVNEGTAIYKIVANKTDLPTSGRWLWANADAGAGVPWIPGDHYLHLAGALQSSFAAAHERVKVAQA